jgi:hypothetical protein
MNFTRESLSDTLKNNQCIVTFTKLNGETRTMPCTLKASDLPVQEIKEGAAPKTQNLLTMSVFVTDIKQWRSFRIDSVTGLEVVS